MNEIEKFKRHVTAISGIYYRIDKGLLTGRNSDATDRSLEMHVRSAQALITMDADTVGSPLCTYLDNNDRLSKKWNALERRFFGLRP